MQWAGREDELTWARQHPPSTSISTLGTHMAAMQSTPCPWNPVSLLSSSQVLYDSCPREWWKAQRRSRP